jgi:hypothetical protein
MNPIIYQYKEVDLNAPTNASHRAAYEDRMMRLNVHGADGWQLVSLLPNMVAIMMRAIEEPRQKRAYTRRADKVLKTEEHVASASE